MRERLRAERQFNGIATPILYPAPSPRTILLVSVLPIPPASLRIDSRPSLSTPMAKALVGSPLNPSRTQDTGFHINTSAIAKAFPGFMDFSSWDPEEVARIDPGLKARTGAARAHASQRPADHATETFPPYNEEKKTYLR